MFHLVPNAQQNKKFLKSGVFAFVLMWTSSTTLANEKDPTGKQKSIEDLCAELVAKSQKEEEQISRFMSQKSQFQISPSDVISEDLKKQIQSVGQQVSSRMNCDNQPCAIVGLGRSPAPIMAAMENLGISSIWHLPLSSFRNHPNQKIGAKMPVDPLFELAQFFPALSKENEQKLFEHFDRYFPSQEELGDVKTVYLMDFGLTGTTLISATRYLERYLIQRERGDIQIIPFFLIYDLSASEFTVLPFIDEEAQSVIIEESSPLGLALLHFQLKEFSPYGSFHVDKDQVVSERPSILPGYEALKEALR